MTANILDFDKVKYKAICEEMRDVLQLKREVEEREKYLKGEILEMSGGERLEYGISVKERTRKGSVDYKAMMKRYLIPDSVAEMYRKEDVTWWEIKSY